jgi:hypothetical protein
MKDLEKEKKFCGNCSSHSPYKYPTQIFCSTRYAQNKNPIVDTLRSCADWTPVAQDCHCVRDALKEKNGEQRNAKVIT